MLSCPLRETFLCGVLESIGRGDGSVWWLRRSRRWVVERILRWPELRKHRRIGRELRKHGLERLERQYVRGHDRTSLPDVQRRDRPRDVRKGEVDLPSDAPLPASNSGLPRPGTLLLLWNPNVQSEHAPMDVPTRLHRRRAPDRRWTHPFRFSMRSWPILPGGRDVPGHTGWTGRRWRCRTARPLDLSRAAGRLHDVRVRPGAVQG